MSNAAASNGSASSLVLKMQKLFKIKYSHLLIYFFSFLLSLALTSFLSTSEVVLSPAVQM